MEEKTIRTKLNYATKWSRIKNAPLKSMSEENAQKAHDTGKLYTVIKGGLENPECFIDIRLEVGYVAVFFLDKKRRIYRDYFFKKIEERLFLTKVITRKFDEKSNKIIKAKEYIFSLEKPLVIRNIDAVAREVIRKEATNEIDLTNNWEDVPEFGQYKSVSRFERNFGSSL